MLNIFGTKERLRKEISKFLIDTNESYSLKCDIIVGEDEAFGLSSLQLLRIYELFQIPGEGIIYYKLEGTNDFEEIETLTKSDLTNVLNYLEENVNIK